MVFKFNFFKYQLTFLSTKWRLSAGRTGTTKAQVNNSNLNEHENSNHIQDDGY